MDREAVGPDLDAAGSLHKFAIEFLWFGLGEPMQFFGQPTVAAVGDHREGDVKIHVESDFARQAIEVEKVNTDAQAIFDAVAPGVAQHDVAGSDFGVVGQEQRVAFASQAGHGNLPQRRR